VILSVTSRCDINMQQQGEYRQSLEELCKLEVSFGRPII
jgi:hypothetical protein